MDGYALATTTLEGTGPHRLRVRGEHRAGGPTSALSPATAMRIFTGARVPAGADAVVPQEDAKHEGDEVVLGHRPRAWQHIRRTGCDVALGAEALSPGARLGPGALALALALGAAEVTVSRRPRLALVSTGDELTPASDARPGAVVDTNGPMLAALAAQAGAEVLTYPIVGDDLSATARALGAALEEADVLVTVGGVSVGDHDHVRAALTLAGVTLDLWKVDLKPGKPLAVGHRAGRVVLGLPGNPGAAFATFALFGMPLLRALQGDAHPEGPRHRLPLAHEHTRKPGRVELARARVTSAGHVELHPDSSPAALAPLAWADAFALLPAEAATLPAGSLVEVVRLAEL
jgi:molybdopterin molybdotransferase